jgi:hypothetical protein
MKEKTQMDKIKDEKITVDTTEIHRITWKYCEDLYSSKLENMEEMDNFLDA